MVEEGVEGGREGGGGGVQGFGVGGGIKRREGTKCKSCEAHENSSTKMESCFFFSPSFSNF